MNFDSRKLEEVIISLIFGCIAIIPLYIAEYIYIYKIHNLTLINDDWLVLSYNVVQILIIASVHYILFRKGK